MVVAIPLKQQQDYTELKYCLRSIDRFIQPSEVLIVGTDLPDWCINVTWINVPDINNRKQLTIKTKIVAALQYSHELLWVHDDIFLLEPYQSAFYWAGSLRNVGESGAKPLMEALQAQGKAILNYDCHSPIFYERSKFEVVMQFNSDCLVKSAYGNWWQIEAIPTTDCKIHNKNQDVRRFIEGRPFFSSSNQSFQWCAGELNRRFPSKSRYEI